MSDSAPLIEVCRVTKRFGERLAVEDVSLTVARGEVYGLLGHNGAGKSTLIGMLLGQVWPTAGEVRLRGYEVSRNRLRALARVGAIFESPVFYDYLSGWRNLEILSHYSAPTSPGRLREVIDWVGLTGRERSPVRTYSHGMRARLALAQSLLPDPELLILDEPGDGLDPAGIAELRATILRLRRELGLTLLLSSHLLGEVEQLCTRIAVLNRGRKVFDGRLSETRLGGVRLRLRTDNFPAAAAGLRAAGLVAARPDSGEAGGPNAGRAIQPAPASGATEGLLVPAPGVGSDAIVRWLVGQHHAVHEIAPMGESLEDFYLRLMGSGTVPPRD